MDPVLILSTGRCGSTMVSEILSRHRGILSLSEFFVPLGWNGFARKAPTGPQMWSMLSQQTRSLHMMLEDGIIVDESLYDFDQPGAKFTPGTIPPILCVTLPHLTDDYEALYDELEKIVMAQPKRGLADQYRFLFGALAEKLDRQVCIERSGGSLMHAATLLKLFPTAKVVHVYRDGRDTALSMSRHHNFRILLAMIRKVEGMGADVTRMWLKPSVGPKMLWMEKAMFRFLDMNALKEKQFAPVDYGWLWSEMILKGLQVLESVPQERLLSVRFEDVQTSPRDMLGRLLQFISPDLEPGPWLDEVSAIPRAARSKYESLPQDEQDALTRACQPGLEKLGYSL